MPGGGMSVLVVEQSVVSAIPPEGLDRILVVPRDRRRDGSWPAVAADAVVATLEAAGSEAVVLARPPAADPGGAALSALAEMMEREVVRLPTSAHAAAWVVGVALAGHEGSPLLLRALQALAGAADRLVAPCGEDDEVRMPAIRPAVLVRWARSGWRPCGRCRGGGLPGARCGRCGASIDGGET
jgi:hypothetical protein